MLYLYGRKENGKLKLWRRERIQEYVSLIPEGAHVIVTLSRERAKRSVNQNNYYWGVVLQILSDHTGYDPKDLHETFRAEYLGYREDPRLPGLRRPISTTELDTKEFEDYLEKIKRWASQFLDCYVPDPNEG